MTSNAAVTAALLDTLRLGANDDGGWGYVRGKASRIEPTCWAMIGLADAGSKPGDADLVRRGLERIAAWQGRDNLLADVPGVLPNLAFNGLAALAVHRTRSLAGSRPAAPSPRLDALLAAIEAARGVLSGSSSGNRQNNALSGWPWHIGTSNWVEPTAWCTLALKKTGAAAAGSTGVRVREAERLLIDRCCAAGGWNYGNSNMLGKELAPYVAATAPALLALQDCGPLPEVAKSVAWLAANWRREPSAMAFSLAVVALTAHHAAVDDILIALRVRLEAAGPPANLASCAQALYALNGAHHAFAAFLL